MCIPLPSHPTTYLLFSSVAYMQPITVQDDPKAENVLVRYSGKLFSSFNSSPLIYILIILKEKIIKKSNEMFVYSFWLINLCTVGFVICFWTGLIKTSKTIQIFTQSSQINFQGTRHSVYQTSQTCWTEQKLLAQKVHLNIKIYDISFSTIINKFCTHKHKF